MNLEMMSIWTSPFIAYTYESFHHIIWGLYKVNRFVQNAKWFIIYSKVFTIHSWYLRNPGVGYNKQDLDLLGFGATSSSRCPFQTEYFELFLTSLFNNNIDLFKTCVFFVNLYDPFIGPVSVCLLNCWLFSKNLDI